MVPPAVNTFVPLSVKAPFTVVVPLKIGLVKVLFAKVSVPDKVAKVPLVGSVTDVAAVVVRMVAKLPDVLKFPPKVRVLDPLFTPVPPKLGEITPAKAALPSKLAPKIVRGVCKVVAVDALPVNAPTKLVDATELRPVTLVKVPPKVALVDPKVIRLLANCPLVILAVADKFAVVKPVAAMLPDVMDIPEPAVKAACLALKIV